jgi:hypothetical protein
MSSLPNVSALPLPRPSPGRIGPGAFDLLETSWRWLRSSGLGASHQRARLRRAASKHQPIVLGTAARPWSPDAESASALRSLAAFGGLEIHITSRSPGLVQSLPTLTALDRDHAVQVDVVVSGPDLRVRGVREGLGVVRRLAAEGIATRLLVGPREAEGADPRRFFAAAFQAGASDVQASKRTRGEREAVRFERLRLQHGFPRAHVGRG